MLRSSASTHASGFGDDLSPSVGMIDQDVGLPFQCCHLTVVDNHDFGLISSLSGHRGPVHFSDGRLPHEIHLNLLVECFFLVSDFVVFHLHDFIQVQSLPSSW